MPETSDGASVLRAMRIEDLEAVLSWRNHPDVRRYMFTQHEISLDEHRAWFERSRGNPDRHLLVFEHSGAPRGFVSLIMGAHPNVADWGFYAAPDAPRGTGRTLGRAALDHAFGSLGLHKVCGQALETNARSIAFHEALGFRREGHLREHHFDNGRYLGVALFGLLAREWARPSEGSPSS